MTSALLLRNTRNSVVDITRMDYVDFARSKGITSGEVRTARDAQRHDLHRHPSEYAHGGHAGRLSHHRDGVLRTGIGKLASDAIFGRDYAVVQYVVLLFAVLVLVINLITDILYSFLDPRVNL